MHLVLPALVLDNLRYHILAVVDYLSDRHVQLHLSKPLRLLIDALDCLKLGHYIVLLTQGDVLYVNQDFFNGNVLATTDRQFYLHCLHQDLVSLCVGPVELGFLVVHSVQEVFQVRYL